MQPSLCSLSILRFKLSEILMEKKMVEVKASAMEFQRPLRKCDNRDDFRNKRLKLAGELQLHIAHARRRMAKSLRRDLYADRSVRPIDDYRDASTVTMGSLGHFLLEHDHIITKRWKGFRV
ncbi:hypothetical protein V6N13_081338 [Hibiscus sabdariffa]